MASWLIKLTTTQSSLLTPKKFIKNPISCSTYPKEFETQNTKGKKKIHWSWGAKRIKKQYITGQKWELCTQRRVCAYLNMRSHYRVLWSPFLFNPLNGWGSFWLRVEYSVFIEQRVEVWPGLHQVASAPSPAYLSPEVTVCVLSQPVMSDSFETPWTAAPQAPLSIEFSRQKYWSGLSFTSPGDIPDPGIEPVSPVSQANSLPVEPSGSSICTCYFPLLVKHHTWKAVLLQEGDPYRELREGSCLTLGNELSEETHVLKKKKTFIG